jgi:hypothetical protein
MPNQQKSEKLLSKILKCGHCGNSAPMEIVVVYNQDITYEDEYERFERNNTFQILFCPTCHEPTIRCIYWDRSMRDDTDLEITILYPPNNNQVLGLPSNIRAAYEAALSVRKIEPNAYAVLIRRLLEMVCTDRAASGKVLNDKLGDLAKKGEIPPQLVSVAKGLKDFGNVGAHADAG